MGVWALNWLVCSLKAHSQGNNVLSLGISCSGRDSLSKISTPNARVSRIQKIKNCSQRSGYLCLCMSMYACCKEKVGVMPLLEGSDRKVSGGEN